MKYEPFSDGSHGHGELTVKWDEQGNYAYKFEGNAGPHDIIWVTIQVIGRLFQDKMW